MRWLASVLLCGLLISGCDNSQSGSATSRPAGHGVRLALLMKSRQNPFFERMAAGAQEAAKAAGVELIVLAVDKETEAEKQAAQIETVVGQGIQAIIITPVDSKAVVAPLMQLQASGIPIVNIDNRIDVEAIRSAGLKLVTFIGPDNVEGARKSTDAMLDKVLAAAGAGGTVEIAMLEGVRGADNAEARKRGFQQAVAARGDRVKVVAMDSAEWMTEPAQKKMEAILNAHPALKGIFCANDMMALGAIQAIASAGKKGQIVVTAYDNLDAARQAIRDNALYATIEQHPDRMGKMGVETALQSIRGASFSPEIPITTDLVTAANMTGSQPATTQP